MVGETGRPGVGVVTVVGRKWDLWGEMVSGGVVIWEVCLSGAMEREKLWEGDFERLVLGGEMEIEGWEGEVVTVVPLVMKEIDSMLS